LVGPVAAELLGLHIGDKVALNGSDVTVAGILDESGSGDDYQIFVPLQTLQTAFDKVGLVSSIDIRALCIACPVEVIADGINRSTPGVRAVAVKQVAAAEMDMMDKVNTFMLALAGITLVVGIFAVINTMIASVNERIKDIGVMRAVGASRNQIIKLFVYEAIIVGILGGIFGYMAGTFLAYIVGPLIFEGTAITYIPQFLPLSLALSTLIAVVATLYPVFRATRVKVADSFRSL
jgi:putative ABC transport system permease protein